MKESIITIVFLVFVSPAISAQYDLELLFQKPQYPDWDRLVFETTETEAYIFDWKAGIGLGYRIFPHEFRLGYRPGVHIFYGKNEVSFTEPDPSFEYRIIQSYLSFPVQIFPFDLWGDCNCPTFGRQHDFFQKAFYFEFIPAISIKQLRFTRQDVGQNAINLAPHLGVGAGLNIALNKWLTFSPMMSYHIGFAEKWKDLGELHLATSAFDQTYSTGWQFTVKTSLYLEER